MVRAKDPDRTAHGEDESFFGRWSRRKAAARSGEPRDDVAERPADEQTSEASGEATPAVRPEDLPDIESLTATSDFKVFMRAGVPEELKTQALRKLWRLKPSLANLDGLVDYGEDLTGRTTVVAAGLRTAYRAGRGYLERNAGEEGERLAERTASDEAEREEPAGDDHPPDEPVAQADPDEPEATDTAVADQASDDVPARRRPLPRRS